MPAHYPIGKDPIVGIDLDDTLAEYDGYKGWKHIGEPRPFAQQFVALFKEHGWITFLFTARPDEGLLWEWLKHWNFTYDGKPSIDYINKSPLNIELKNCSPAKPIADLYIDNAAWPFCGHPVPLEKVAKDMIERGIFEGHGMGKASHDDRSHQGK